MDCSTLTELFNFSINYTNHDENSKILIIRNFSSIINDCLIDKLREEIRKVKAPDTPIQRIYYLESLINLFGDPYLSELNELADMLKNEIWDPWTTAIAYSCMAKIYFDKNYEETAKAFLSEAEEKLDDILDNSDRSDAQKRMAILYADMGDIKKSLKLVRKINYEKRRIEAILTIIEILLNKNLEKAVDKFIKILPPEWKIVSMGIIANHNFIKEKKEQALTFMKHVLDSIKFLHNKEAKIETVKKILPIIIEYQSVKEAKKIIEKSDLNHYNLTKFIDWYSIKVLKPSKILTLEILLMDIENKEIREELEKDIALVFLDMLCGKDIKSKLDKIKENLNKLDERERTHYVIKISNILVEIFGKNILC